MFHNKRAVTVFLYCIALAFLVFVTRVFGATHKLTNEDI